MHDDLSATRSLSLCFPPLLCSPNHYFLKQKIEEAEWVVQACDLCSCVLRARNCWSSPLVLWVVARRLPGEGPHARTGVPCFLSCEKCEPPLRAMVGRACLPVIPVGGQACHLLVVLGVGIRSIRVFRFGLFGFCEFRVSKNENRNFKDKIRNRTRIDRIFRFGLFGPPN